MSDEESSDYTEDSKQESHFVSVLYNDDETNTASAKRARKRVSIEWSTGSIEMLISAVKSCDLLWNINNPNYRSRTLRNKAWDSIAQTVFYGEFDSEQLAAKWGNLRVQFNACLSKSQKDESGGQESTNVSWKYFNPMMFIVEHQPAADSGSIKKVKRSLKEKPEVEGRPIKRPKPTSSPEPEALKISKLEPLNGTEMFSTPRRETSISNVVKREKVDSFQVFGNYIAEELRKIPDRAVANRIQRKLTRFFMDCLDEADATGSLYSSSDPGPAITGETAQ